MVPNQLPKHLAHTNLILGGDFVTRMNYHSRVFHHLLLFGKLKDLIAKIDKSDTERVGTTVHDHKNHITKLIVVIKDVNRI